MEKDEYGKAKRITEDILKERGYFLSSGWGGSLSYRNHNNKKFDLWTSPAYWDTGGITVFWGGLPNNDLLGKATNRIQYLHELIAFEESIK